MGWEAATRGNAIPAPIPARIRCTIWRRVSARSTACPSPSRCNLSLFVTVIASQSLVWLGVSGNTANSRNNGNIRPLHGHKCHAKRQFLHASCKVVDLDWSPLPRVLRRHSIDLALPGLLASANHDIVYREQSLSSAVSNPWLIRQLRNTT
jgi:hypothetical protein